LASGTRQYFDAAPGARSRPRTVALTLPDLTCTLQSDSAVFSGDRIDPGTKLLLLDVPPPRAGATNALDLGCGYGPIAVTLAHRLPAATVWAVDTNPRAVELCRTNAAATGAGSVRASVVTAERPWGEVPDDVGFDVIWSNPPIRIGKAAMHELLTRWLDRLADGGVAHLVVQKHLGSDSLARWLAEQGWPTERISSRAGYRILEVRARSHGRGDDDGSSDAGGPSDAGGSGGVGSPGDAGGPGGPGGPAGTGAP
jgi:16S rRNA (guanine1207-N2)-methyltransferase